MPRLDDACIAQPFEHQHGYGYADDQGKDDEEGGDAVFADVHDQPVHDGQAGKMPGGNICFPFPASHDSRRVRL